MAEKTIFKRIIDKEIPADIVHEDSDCLAFCDINPQAPVHLLVIPKKEIASTDDVADEDAALIGRLMLAIRDIAREQGLAEDGYRVVANCGPNAGQEVPHLHFHILGGRKMTWPPG